MLDGNASRALSVFASMPTPIVQTTVTVLLIPVVQMVMMSRVPMMVTDAGNSKVSLGASLRDRATLPSPLRGLGPSGGYPSRLRSLRSLRAPLARRLAALAAVAGTTRSRRGSTVMSK